MSETTTTPRAPRLRLILTIAGVVVVALFIVALIGGYTQALNEANAKLTSTSKQLKAAKVAVANQADRASRAESNLATCAVAFYAQQEVSGELRDESKRALTALSDYVSTLGGSTLDSDGMVDEIQATNDKEAAIDSSGCDASSN